MENLNARCLFLLFTLTVAAGALAQNKWSRVKIWGDGANLRTQKEFIHGVLQVDHCHFEDGAYVVEIGEAEMQMLKASRYRYEAVVDDVAESFRLTNDPSAFYQNSSGSNRLGFAQSCRSLAGIIPAPLAFTPGSMGGYYTYAEMVIKIGNLANAYPAIVDTFSIGRSIEGRAIWCVKISDNVLADEAEPEVMFNGLQHAREAISGTGLVFFLQYLAENYATVRSVQQLVNNRELFIIPCVNPDGYVYNQTTNPSGGGNWRKNRRPLGSGEYGVDLNRNYNANWANCVGAGGSVASCGSGAATSANGTYWGTAPFSEPETRAVRDFTAARNFRMTIDQHSEGAYNTLPHGRVSLHPTHNLVDSQFLYGFASSAMATYNCHRLGNNLQTLDYEVAGGNKDWMFQGDTSMAVNGRKVYSFTSEAGGGSFWPSASQIIPLSKGLTFQYLQAALAAGGYADLQDAGDAALTSRNGTFAFQLRRVGILDAPVTVSVIPLQNISGVGAPVTYPVGTFPAYYSTTSGSVGFTLPAVLGSGQVVKFVWRVSTEGIDVDDTVTKIYNPVTVFYDDMESGTVSARWNVSSGWGYTAAGLGLNGSGKSLAESPSGNYPSGAARTVTYANPLDLSDATAAYLSFWVRHRSENCQDVLRIRISTNGGASYTNLCGRLTVAESFGTLGGQPGLTGIREEWSRELVDLSNYIGAGMNDIRLQFQFLSNNDPSDGVDPYYKKTDDGFFLDNIRLMKSTSTLSVLPLRFLSFGGKPQAAGGIELTWQAETNAQHHRFEVERSADGFDYGRLGQVATAPPCLFIDATALPGINFYRIKQVDKDGAFAYSKTIAVTYGRGNLDYVLYPNPATDGVTVRIGPSGSETLTLILFDAYGRKLREEKVVVRRDTGASVQLSLKAYATPVFLLNVLNAKGEVLATERIVKQP